MTTHSTPILILEISKIKIGVERQNSAYRHKTTNQKTSSKAKFFDLLLN